MSCHNLFWVSIARIRIKAVQSVLSSEHVSFLCFVCYTSSMKKKRPWEYFYCGETSSNHLLLTSEVLTSSVVSQCRPAGVQKTLHQLTGIAWINHTCHVVTLRGDVKVVAVAKPRSKVDSGVEESRGHSTWYQPSKVRQTNRKKTSKQIWIAGSDIDSLGGIMHSCWRYLF